MVGPEWTLHKPYILGKAIPPPMQGFTPQMPSSLRLNLRFRDTFQAFYTGENVVWNRCWYLESHNLFPSVHFISFKKFQSLSSCHDKNKPRKVIHACEKTYKNK